MRSLFFILILHLVGGCQAVREENHTETRGFGGTIKRIWRDLPDLDPPSLGRFTSRIQETGSRMPTTTASTSAVASRESLASAYLKAVNDVGGVPRRQGEEILQRLLAKDSTACGGASCSKIFELSPESVDTFMDAMMVKTGLSPSLLEPARTEIRKTLLTSLRPDDVREFEEAFSQTLAEISASVPVTLPRRVVEPSTILPRYQYHQRGGEKFVQAVYAYSGSEYTNIRLVENGSLDLLRKNGLSDARVDQLKNMVLDINEGLAKFPKVRETIYRGMKDVSREQIQNWRTFWEKDEAFGLGVNNKPGLTSASWDPEVAKKFMGIGHVFSLKTTYGVVMEITNHQGVSIQTISKVLSEKEVLIPSNMRFKIEQMSLLDQSHGIIHIKVRGVDSASRMRLAEAKVSLAA